MTEAETQNRIRVRVTRKYKRVKDMVGIFCRLTFISAEKEIQKIVRSRGVKNYLENKAVKWTFITPRASWMGGPWQRMVKSVKRCLKRC